MHEAIWYAWRIDQANPQRKASYQFPFQQNKRQQPTELSKPATTAVSPTAPSDVIQQAQLKGVCYKCKENWFPGHKKVCKMSNTAQIQALQHHPHPTPDILYVTECVDDVEEE
jgi:hypothetical protein